MAPTSPARSKDQLEVQGKLTGSICDNGDIAEAEQVNRTAGRQRIQCTAAALLYPSQKPQLDIDHYTH